MSNVATSLQHNALPAMATPRNEPDSADPLLRGHLLPVRLVLEAPVVEFTVRTLMNLAPGAIVETAAQHNEDLMLHVNGQLVGMVKFDVTGDKLAVRLTGLA